MKRSKKAKPSGGTSAADRLAGSRPQRPGNLPRAPGPEAPAPSAPASWRVTILAVGLIVLAAVAAYHNSFGGPFIYDDMTSILENSTIRQLWPIWPVLSPPANGETVSGRPLLNLSLAINYALGGLNVWGYHAANLVIHIAAALLLFGILRQTFLMPTLCERFGRAATPLALASVLLWTLHPLQTESVTYIVQRAESLAGFCYLVTLYCVIRGAEGTVPSEGRGTRGQRRVHRNAESSPPRPGQSIWYLAAILVCLLGVAIKEVLVTVPLIVLLYDRTFLAGSFVEAWRRRWGLYLGLVATWGVLGYLVFSTGLISRQPEIGAPTPLSYARSQPGVILHYLRLSVWPSSLCMGYDWPVASRLGKILPGAIVVGLLLAATIWGLVRRKAWGFLGAWFFLILAPTSSILPLNQLSHEHRMYLSLAAEAVLAVAGGYVLWGWLLFRLAGREGQSPFPPGLTRGRFGSWGAKKGTVPGLDTAVRWAAPVVVLAAVLLALGSATVGRNSVFQSPLAIWQDGVDKSPNNAMAHTNLGIALDDAGRTDEAIAHYHQALRLKPGFAQAYNNLGNSLFKTGKTNEAIEHYRQALRLKPDHPGAHDNLGFALAATGKTEEAIVHYQEALRLKPDFAEAHYNLAIAVAGLGRTDEASEHYQEAIRLKPDYVKAHNNFGALLDGLGKTDEAIAHYQQALRLKPDFADAHNNLGIALAKLGKTDEAIAQYQEALRLKPDCAETHYNLGIVLAAVGKTGEAIEHYQQAVRLKPAFAQARSTLAGALVSSGRTAEAIEQYGQFLRSVPDSPTALGNLAWLLATSEPARGGDPARAVQLAQRARDLGGQQNAQCLDTLAAAYAAAGRFADAVVAAERATELAESAGQTALAKNIQSRLELYRAGQAYREAPRPSGQTKP